MNLMILFIILCLFIIYMEQLGHVTPPVFFSVEEQGPGFSSPKKVLWRELNTQQTLSFLPSSQTYRAASCVCRYR